MLTVMGGCGGGRVRGGGVVWVAVVEGGMVAVVEGGMVAVVEGGMVAVVEGGMVAVVEGGWLWWREGGCGGGRVGEQQTLVAGDK